jgi:NitT/TauT family transport system substrate-binding protein
MPRIVGSVQQQAAADHLQLPEMHAMRRDETILAEAVNRREVVTALVALPALARPAAAELSSIRLGKQYGLPFLPQMVMEAHGLIERHAAALGINGLNVSWQTMGGPGALNDGLLSGQIQFVNVAAPSLATLWDKTLGSPIEVRAICTVQSMPYVLVTRNPNVRTIADFTDADRIAVPTVKISGQAVALQMAAASTWGIDKYDKLDAFTVTMGHPDAMQSLLSGQTINSHFAVAPFNYYELRNPGVHMVLKSYDTVGGKHTNGIQVTTKAFHDANPKICMAVRNAHEEANAYIRQNARQAAEIYLKLANDRKSSADDLVTMITDPDISYTTAPANLMKHVEFMHKVGRIKHMAKSWKDLFFVESHDLDGS